MTDPQDLFDSQASSSEPIWEQELDRRRLVGNAIMATVGAAFLAGPAAEAAASRGAIASPSLRTGSRKAKTSMYVAASGAYQGFNPDKPATIASGPSLANVIACYDSLTDIPIPAQYAAAQKLGKKGYPAVPKLAKSWTVSSDGTVYRLHLRPAVSSSRGNRFTANDVVWSLSKAMNGKFVAAFLLVLCGIAKPDQLKVINPLTLDIHLNAPPPPYFMQILGLPWVPIFDSTEAKKHVTSNDPFAQDWLDTNIAGFGPYTLQSNIPGTFRAGREPDYWEEAADHDDHPGPPRDSKQAPAGPDRRGRLHRGVVGPPARPGARSARTKVTYFTRHASPSWPWTTRAAVELAGAPAGDRTGDSVQRHHQDRLPGTRDPVEDADHAVVPGSHRPVLELRDESGGRTGSARFGEGMQVTLSYVQGFGAGQQIAILVQNGLNAAGLNCQLEGPLRVVADQRNFREVSTSSSTTPIARPSPARSTTSSSTSRRPRSKTRCRLPEPGHRQSLRSASRRTRT